MKKILIVLFALCIAQVTNAQLRIEAGGALGGFGRSSFNGIYIIRTTSTLSTGIGFDANISYKINIADEMGIAPGVGYLMSNAPIKGESVTMRTQWIQVPINFVCDVPTGSLTFTSAIGLYYGRAISGKFIGSSEYDGYDFIKQTSEHILKRNDFGFNVKAGLLLTRNFGFYIGYQRGFLDISDTKGMIAHTNQFRFGIMFSL